jgi:hypothetical protein
MAQLDESETKMEKQSDDWIEFNVFEPVSGLSKNYPFFPKEVLPNFDLFKTGAPVYISNSDYYVPLLYDGLKLRVQTPVLYVPFPLQTYQNKGSTIDKYSLQLSLQSHTPDTKEFKTFVQSIDTLAMSLVPLPPELYFSCIRYSYTNPQLPPIMRIKIPADKETLLVDCYCDGVSLTEPSIQTLRDVLSTHCSVKCILELNNIWVVPEKFGVSWKLIQISVYEHQTTGPLFRPADT